VNYIWDIIEIVKRRIEPYVKIPVISRGTRFAKLKIRLSYESGL